MKIFLNAQNFISVVQKRQGIMIGCPEEVAFKNNWINKIPNQK